MCRNDKSLINYQLNLDLNGAVGIDNGKFESQSVGRLGITLYKIEKGRWDNLLYTGENAKTKPGNMIVWWDLIEKYEDELD